MKILAKDMRIISIVNDRDRERLFSVFISEKEAKERAKAAKKHDVAINAYNAILRVLPFLYVESSNKFRQM